MGRKKGKWRHVLDKCWKCLQSIFIYPFNILELEMILCQGSVKGRHGALKEMRCNRRRTAAVNLGQVIWVKCLTKVSNWILAPATSSNHVVTSVEMETGSSGQTQKRNTVVRSWMSAWDNQDEAPNLAHAAKEHSTTALDTTCTLHSSNYSQACTKNAKGCLAPDSEGLSSSWFWYARSVWMDHGSEDWQFVLNLRVACVDWTSGTHAGLQGQAQSPQISKHTLTTQLEFAS